MEELLEQMPTKDTPVDDNLLRNIPYLKACVTEAFRICPATPNIARILEKEMEVEGYRLPAGVRVFTSYTIIFSDPQRIFTNSNAFLHLHFLLVLCRR